MRRDDQRRSPDASGCPFEPMHDSRDMRGRGRGTRIDSLISQLLNQAPDMQILFVGSLCCARHKPFEAAAKLMQEKKLSMLCPSMSDFATGRYLHQVEEAILELAAERNSKHFALIHGCQWVILSSDVTLLQQELREQHDIELTVKDDSHLIKGSHA